MDSSTAIRIRETAHDLIAERGYSGFSYADIADTVGIRKASIHHHFPTKVDLVVATLKEYRARLAEATGGLNHNVVDPLQRLRLYVEYWKQCVKNNRRPICIAVQLGTELPSLPEEIQVEVKLYFKYLVAWVRTTLKEGNRNDKIQLHDSAEVEAQSFVAVMHGAMISARALGSSDIFNSITKGALERLRSSKREIHPSLPR